MLNVTQTGVVMSKTVKRVMTVMMIGLVAMLGTKAEAHTWRFNGIVRTCSTCGHGTFTELDLKSLHPAVAELVVKTKEARIECDDGSIVTLRANNPAILVARTLSTKWIYNPETQKAEVEFFVPGESDDLFALLGFCSEANPLVEVQILKLSARFEVSQCLPIQDPSNPCSARVLLVTTELKECEVALNARERTTYSCDEVVPQREAHPSPRTR